LLGKYNRNPPSSSSAPSLSTALPSAALARGFDCCFGGHSAYIQVQHCETALAIKYGKAAYEQQAQQKPQAFVLQPKRPHGN